MGETCRVHRWPVLRVAVMHCRCLMLPNSVFEVSNSKADLDTFTDPTIPDLRLWPGTKHPVS